MRGARIPVAKRIINNPSFPPLNPLDFSEANANNLMFLWDNMGTGEFLEDAALLLRHLRQLFAREQVTPNLTLEVLAGIGWFSTTGYMDFPGGSSPTFTAPSVNPRRDLLVLRNDGSATGILTRIAGAEAVTPVAPTPSSTDIPLCQVFNRVGQTKIRDNDTQEAGHGFIEKDLRSFLQVPVGGSAMPKIGLVARTQNTISADGGADTGFVDAVNFSGAGRANSIHISIFGGTIATHEFILTIDGVIFISTSNPGPNQDLDVIKLITNNANSLTLISQTASPTGDNPKGVDLFLFKQSLRIQHRIFGGASGAHNSKITLDWEHE